MFLYLSAINCVPCAKKKAAVFGETMDLEGDTQSPLEGRDYSPLALPGVGECSLQKYCTVINI